MEKILEPIFNKIKEYFEPIDESNFEAETDCDPEPEN